MADPTKDVLARPATRHTVERLAAAGLLSPAARVAALADVCPPRRWSLWADRLLLFLGAALCLSGVVFFFAYNWAAMTAFHKFALIEAGLAACVVAAWRVGLDGLPGKVLVLAASTLVGVLLAVYGQTYQTGADAFELFVGWALLILPWVVTARFGGLWLLWLVVAETAVTAYFGQVLDGRLADADDWCVLTLVLMNGAFLVWREASLAGGSTWLRGPYLRWVVLAALLCLTTSAPAGLAFKYVNRSMPVYLTALSWLVVAAAAYGYYRHRKPDVFALTMLVLSASVVLLCHLGRHLFDLHHGFCMFLVFGFVIGAVVAAGASWLTKIRAALIEGEVDHAA